jgi:hypothetical protein
VRIRRMREGRRRRRKQLSAAARIMEESEKEMSCFNAGWSESGEGWEESEDGKGGGGWPSSVLEEDEGARGSSDGSQLTEV